MELRLTFKTKEIADLYQESYEAWDKEWRDYFHTKKLPTVILLCTTILTFGLTLVHFDWIYYGAFFLIITVIYYLKTRRQKRMRDKEAKKWRSEVELFLKKYENIADIKYTYDNEKAQYFEQGKLVVEILWSDVLTMNTNDKWIYVYMKNPRQNIWIPRVTADEEELKLFEQTIEHRLQDAANNMNKS